MHGKDERDSVSADSMARSVSRTVGVDRVRALQRVLYRCAKQDRDRRFHALFDKVARSDVMRRAWSEVRANHGAAGVDGVTIDDIEASGVGDFLDGLAAALRAGTYRPRPLRRVRIAKPGRPGQSRPLGIPTVADRVVMAAARIVLEPIFGVSWRSCGRLAGESPVGVMAKQPVAGGRRTGRPVRRSVMTKSPWGASNQPVRTMRNPAASSGSPALQENCGSRAQRRWVKAIDGAKILEVRRLWARRGMGSGTVG
jgi:hypothetical protein